MIRSFRRWIKGMFSKFYRPLTMNMVLTVPSSEVIVIGDVHGCLQELKLLLQKCKYSPKEHTVVLVGDLVNKGNLSASVIKYCREIGAYCVRGNHDCKAISYANEHLKGNTVPEAYAYVKDLDSQDVEWLQNLPFTIALPQFEAFIVHAGLVPHVPLQDQKPEHLYTMRNLIQPSSKDAPWDASALDIEGAPWASLWSEELAQHVFTGTAMSSSSTSAACPHIYFGHDAKRGLQQYPFATGLDTGCCYGRKLTACVLPQKELVEVDALEMYVVPATE